MTKILGNTISLNEIKEAVRQRTSIEFTSNAKQVNLNNPEIQDYIKQVGHLSLPPLNNKKEIFKALWVLDTSDESLKWDYIVLLTYLSDGEIFYQIVADNSYLVTIKF